MARLRALARIVCVALVVSAAASIELAAGQGPAPAIPPAAAAEMTPFQVQQLFDAMLVMQAQEVLSLSEQQYAQFLTRLKVLQDTRRRNQQERARLINELQRLTNARNMRPNVNEAMMKERLSALQELESRSAAESRKAYNAIDEILDVYQQARFRVLEEQIERRKLELVGRARQLNPNRPNPLRRDQPR